MSVVDNTVSIKKTTSRGYICMYACCVFFFIPPVHKKNPGEKKENRGERNGESHTENRETHMRGAEKDTRGKRKL